MHDNRAEGQSVRNRSVRAHLSAISLFESLRQSIVALNLGSTASEKAIDANRQSAIRGERSYGINPRPKCRAAAICERWISRKKKTLTVGVTRERSVCVTIIARAACPHQRRSGEDGVRSWACAAMGCTMAPRQGMGFEGEPGPAHRSRSLLVLRRHNPN